MEIFSSIDDGKMQEEKYFFYPGVSVLGCSDSEDGTHIIGKSDFTKQYEDYLKSKEAELTYLNLDDMFSVNEFDKTDFINNVDSYILDPKTYPILSRCVEDRNSSKWDTVDLIEKLSDEEGVKADEIIMINSYDFDGNGEEEAFVFTGEYDDEEGSVPYSGKVWFVSSLATECVREEEDYWKVDGFLLASEKAYAFFDIYAATMGYSVVYGVKDGVCYESELSETGSIVEPCCYDEKCSFTVIRDAYDCIFDPQTKMMMGHSYRPYYYYVDKNGEFAEYTGIPITESELDELCGFEMSKEIHEKGYSIMSIYNRDNGIISVNYYIEDGDGGISYDQVNWDNNTKKYIDAWGTGENTMENSGYGGTYVYE